MISLDTFPSSAVSTTGSLRCPMMRRWKAGVSTWRKANLSPRRVFTNITCRWAYLSDSHASLVTSIIFRFILKTVKNYKREGEFIFNALMLLQHNRDLKGLFDSIISITLFCFYLKFNNIEKFLWLFQTDNTYLTLEIFWLTRFSSRNLIYT